MRTVVGLFDNVTEAQRTIEELVRYGLATENISIVTSPSAQRALEHTAHVGLRTMDVADIGRVAASGPLSEAVKGPNGSGSLTAALQRFGLSSDLAARYAAGVRQGETLESVLVDDRRADEVVDIMQRHSHIRQQQLQQQATKPLQQTRPAEQTRPTEQTRPIEPTMPLQQTRSTEPTRPIDQTRPPAPPSPASSIGHEFGPDEDITIPIVREELHVGKREIRTGGVRVDVKVVEKPVASDLRLREEVVEIERRPVDRSVRPDEQVLRNKQLEMAEYAEEPIASKQARVVEEVILRKKTKEHVERVQDTVKNTEIDIDRPFDPSLYRTHFDRQGGGAFDDYVPAYKLGHELRGDARLQGSRWDEIEPQVRERWESHKPGTWAKFKDAIKHAWSRM